MSGIILYTKDAAIAGRISAVLHSTERLLWNSSEAPWDADAPPLQGALRVIDGRGRSRDDLFRELLALRQASSDEIRCIALASLDQSGIQAVGYLGTVVTDVIFPEVDHVELVVRAHLNDCSRSIAGAVAMSVLSGSLPQRCHSILNSTVGSGLAASSVKECAAQASCDRGTLRRALQRSGTVDSPPCRLVAVAKATYAVALLRTTGLTRTSIARTIRFGRCTTLDRLLRRVFDRDAETVRREAPQIEVRVHASL